MTDYFKWGDGEKNPPISQKTKKHNKWTNLGKSEIIFHPYSLCGINFGFLPAQILHPGVCVCVYVGGGGGGLGELSWC